MSAAVGLLIAEMVLASQALTHMRLARADYDEWRAHVRRCDEQGTIPLGGPTGVPHSDADISAQAQRVSDLFDQILTARALAAAGLASPASE